MNRGYKVDLIVLRKVGKYFSELDININVINLNCSRLMFSLFSLIKYLNKNKPDVLLSSLTHVNIISVFASIFCNIKFRLIVIEHSLKIIENKKLNFKQRLLEYLISVTYPRAFCIIAVSNDVAKNIAYRSGVSSSKIYTVFNPSFSSSIITKSKLQIDHPWFSKDQPPVIISVGRLTAEKNFSHLLMAFNRVRIKQRARLIILGEGKLRNDLMSLALELGVDKDFELPGFVENPYAYMSKSSLFVMSSNYEGFGNVLVEAMACGVPIISTNCPGGPSEILENVLWGTLIPLGNVEALSDSILNTLNKNKKEHQNCLKRANDFSIDKKIEEYIKIIFQD